MKSNWKTVIRMHQVMILLLLIPVFFINNEYKKLFLIFLGLLVFSLFVQVFFYAIKPGWFGDKVKTYPEKIQQH